MTVIVNITIRQDQ